MRATLLRKLLKIALPSGLVRYRGSRGRNYLALTFDDGPVPGISEKIARTLAGRGHRATFFVIGRKAKAHPQLMRAIVESGSELGNHTYSHRLLTRARYADIASEVRDTDEILKTAAPEPGWFRPPGGQLSWKVLVCLWKRKARRSPILWSACIPRENTKSKDEILLLLQRAQLSAGDILLLHDDHPVILEALPEILDLIEQRGLRSVSVTELLQRA